MRGLMFSMASYSLLTLTRCSMAVGFRSRTRATYSWPRHCHMLPEPIWESLRNGQFVISSRPICHTWHSTESTSFARHLEVMDTIALFSSQQIEAVARVLADTNGGLTGSEIAFILRDAVIPDIDSSNTKWKRLYNALASIQNEKQIGNHVLMVVTRAMNPIRYTGNQELFHQRRQTLNAVLSLTGYELREDGRVQRVRVAQSVDEAVQRASRLSAALVSRGVHQDVLQYCRA